MQPLSDVKHHRLIGYCGRDETVEYVTCKNPYYRAEQPVRGEQFNRLDELDAPDDVSRQVVNIDRILLRPRGSSHGVIENVFIRGTFDITQFGAPRVNYASNLENSSLAASVVVEGHNTDTARTHA